MQNVKLSSSKKTLFTLIVSFAAICFVSLFYSRRMLVLNPTFSRCYLIISAAVTAAFFALFVFLNKKALDISVIYTVTVSFFAVMYMFIFPPFCVPDEPTHFLLSYRISNLFLLKPSALFSDTLTLRKCDKELFDALGIDLIPSAFNSLKTNFTVFAKDTAGVSVVSSPLSNAYLGYAASAFGIAIARILHLGAVGLLFSGRFFNAAACIALGTFAIKKMPYSKSFILVLSALPMTLHLFSSYSYDGLVIMFAVCFVSQVLYIKEIDGITKKSDVILLFAFAFLLAPSKLVYLPIVATVFIIPKEKFGLSKGKSLLLKLSVFAIAVLSLCVFEFPSLYSHFFSSENYQSSLDVNTYTFPYLLAHPLKTANIFLNTIKENYGYYFYTFFGSKLSWLNVIISKSIIWCFALLLVFCIIKRKGEEKSVKASLKIFCLLIFAAVYFLVLLSMLVSWTKFGSASVSGVQGRYFLPLAPIILLILRNDLFAVSSALDKYIPLALFVGNFTVLTISLCYVIGVY